MSVYTCTIVVDNMSVCLRMYVYKPYDTLILWLSHPFKNIRIYIDMCMHKGTHARKTLCEL